MRVLPSTTPPRRSVTGRMNLLDRTWEQWQERTRELPPDFEAMPSNPFLPDPLVDFAGKQITSTAEWARRRQEIRAQFEQWVFGTFPPAPDNLRATVVKEQKEGEVTVRDVLLEFGPNHRARLRLQLMIPPGKGPFPVFLTNHARNRPWAATAVRRGYIGCIYFATDPIYGNGDDSETFLEAFPEASFSCLARWAWAAMRAVDYLVTLPEADRARIAITGHSRNGKQALLAAAFDERIGAVALSSGNTGEGTPWRYTTDPFVNESIEQITTNFPHWFHPRLRFFAGREHKLPVDQNLLMALVAPRGLLLASAYPEAQGAPWAFEQAYDSVRKVYQFLNKTDNVGLSLRAGEHPTVAEDIEKYVDFFDTVFGRAKYPRPETRFYGYSFERWQKLSGEKIDPRQYPEKRPSRSRQEILRQIHWILGEEPAGVPFPSRTKLAETIRTSDGWLADLYKRPLQAPGMSHTGLSFGDDLKADLYFPASSDGKPAKPRFPVVVWLHPFSHSTGYSRFARPHIPALVERGFAVLAFDQIGYGTRIEQGTRFYERYPRWSLLGKMVADTRAAIDALAALEIVDASRIYLSGYSLGGKVALFTAALDERVRGVAAVSAFTPLRLDGPGKGIEGIRQYSHLHGLLPRLGFFIGHEQRIPVDYDDVLSAIAPRPVLIFAPTHDRYAPIADVKQAVASARKAWEKAGKTEALRLETPVDFNRFPPERLTAIANWLAGEP